MITLYDFTMAPSPRRARIVLAEKGIPHEKIPVDLAKGEQMGDAYRAINPLCTVPALKLEDGHILTDNAGIAAWAEAAYPNPPLLGTSPIEKAEIASWNARIEFEALYAIADALRNTAPSMKDRALTGPVNYSQIPALAERGAARITAFMDMFNAHLAGRGFVVAGRFTVADITAVVAIDFARVIKIKPQEHHGDLLRWRMALAARPSISA
jgi:glutathione S-transferase